MSCPVPLRYAFSPLVDEQSNEAKEQLMNDTFGKSHSCFGISVIRTQVDTAYGSLEEEIQYHTLS